MISIGSTMRLSCYSICWLALGCNGNSIDALIRQLRDGNTETRRLAIHTLSEHRNAKGVISAVAEAVGDSDAEIRRVAIYVLGESGTQATSFLPILMPALEDPQLSVRLAAALAIQKIEPDNETFVPVLVNALLVGEGEVFLEVAEMGPDAKWAVPTLIRLLSHPETKIRALTAYTLGQLGATAREAEAALTRALKDPQNAVRSKAGQALEQIQSEQASEE